MSSRGTRLRSRLWPALCLAASLIGRPTTAWGQTPGQPTIDAAVSEQLRDGRGAEPHRILIRVEPRAGASPGRCRD